MIAVKNPQPSLLEFKKLMEKTDIFLNSDAKKRSGYYKSHTAQKLEKDVCYALNECSKGTQFYGTIELVSGSSFPDIVADNLYGVEVKSTEKNHWTSTGSSILESTRVTTVERIYMTFGKLGGNPVEFKSRPYEECLSEIAVTHYPRYKIDMNLKNGETIFDKMGTTYDELRKLKNPVAPVAKYYKSRLNDGETLWWAPDSVDKENGMTFSAKLLSNCDLETRNILTAKMLVLFPELCKEKSNSKYERAALWLVSSNGITTSNLRDFFSSGGQEEMKTMGGVIIKMPAIFRRIKNLKDLICNIINEADISTLSRSWNIHVDNKNRLYQWCILCAKNYCGENSSKYKLTMELLAKEFSLYYVDERTLRVAEK